jgi:hypothetical protein
MANLPEDVGILVDAIGQQRQTTQSIKEPVESEKNLLHQYASYNTLFTLSALTPEEMRFPALFMQNAPHDIIARSAGIGNPKTSNRDRTNSKDPSTPLNDREKASITRAQSILDQGRDIYFENVDIKSIHGYNPDRRTGSVTQIKMRLTEPAGISILEKFKAAAYNCGYRDHIDAPYLLTMQFRGFDEKGQVLAVDTLASKRYIPIKISRMHINLTSAGATYDIEAIAWNETGYMNRFMNTRTPIGGLDGKTLRTFVESLMLELNKMTEKEAEAGFFTKGKQDRYQISVDPMFADQPLQMDENKKSTNTAEMKPYDEQGKLGEENTRSFDYGSKAGSVAIGTSVLKILEEAMTNLKPIQSVVSDWYKKTLNTIRQRNNNKTVTEKDFAALDDSQFYVTWFKIRSSVEIDTANFDDITKQHRKIVTYHIDPYRLHVFKLYRPGISLGAASEVAVKRIYDYIFTGKNTDILNLDINYKIAFYQTRLLGLNPNQRNFPDAQGNTFNTISGLGDQIEDLQPTRSHPSGSRSAGSGVFGGENKLETDLFMDALTNPEADMTRVSMKILGDPAWIGVSQYMSFQRQEIGNILIGQTQSVVSTNATKTNFDADKAYSEKYKCFNVDTTDPVVRLRFRMPTDLNNTTGLYELGNTESAVFSGLYEVWRVDTSFDRGQFTQTLHMGRFNNQSDTKQTKVKESRISIDLDDIIKMFDFDTSKYNPEME